jgi:hypothetical protein
MYIFSEQFNASPDKLTMIYEPTSMFHVWMGPDLDSRMYNNNRVQRAEAPTKIKFVKLLGD